MGKMEPRVKNESGRKRGVIEDPKKFCQQPHFYYVWRK
jgi:hypothetical protein